MTDFREPTDVAAVPSLGGPGPNRLFVTARTVLDTTNVEVSVIVILDHELTDTDIAAVESLGGRVTSRWSAAVQGYAVVVPDSIVPAVRQLPGASLVEPNFASVCGF